METLQDKAIEVLKEVKEYFINYDHMDTFKLASLLTKIDSVIFSSQLGGKQND